MPGFITRRHRGRLLSRPVAGLAVFFLVTALVALPAGAANRLRIELAKTADPLPPDTVYVGSDYEFRIGIENDVVVAGISLGFEISSPDGVTWRWNSQPGGYGPEGPGSGGNYLTVASGSRMDPTSVIWDFGDLLVIECDVDGRSPDTLFPGASALFNGLPSGPMEHMLSLHFTPMTEGTDSPGTLCIDSAFVPPAGDWIFVDEATGLTIIPEFTGPYCWPVVFPDYLTPMVVVVYSPVNVIVEDPDGLQFGRDSLGNPIEEIPNAEYHESPHDSVVIHDPKLGDYTFYFVTEAGADMGSTYSAIVKIDGTEAAVIVLDETAPESGTAATYGYTVEVGYHYVNGDANRDESVDVGDAVFVINYVFRGGAPPDPTAAGDANCDGEVNVGDAVRIISYVFRNGASPCYFEP